MQGILHTRILLHKSACLTSLLHDVPAITAQGLCLSSQSGWTEVNSQAQAAAVPSYRGSAMCNKNAPTKIVPRPATSRPILPGFGSAIKETMRILKVQGTKDMQQKCSREKAPQLTISAARKTKCRSFVQRRSTETRVEV